MRLKWPKRWPSLKADKTFVVRIPIRKHTLVVKLWARMDLSPAEVERIIRIEVAFTIQCRFGDTLQYV